MQNRHLCRICGEPHSQRVVNNTMPTDMSEPESYVCWDCAEDKRVFCTHHAQWHKDEYHIVSDVGGECEDCNTNESMK